MTNSPLTPGAPRTAPSTKKRAGAGRRLLKNPLGAGSLGVLVAVIILGQLGPLLAEHDPNFASLDAINAPVGTPGYPMGGDQYGRDILARLISSINVSLVSGAIGAGVAIALGTTFGLIAGYVGKKTDAITSWAFNLLMTFPALVLVLVLSPITGGSYQVMMVIFGIFLAPGTYRLVRNMVVGVRNELYVDAARVAGLSNRRILSRHVLYVVRGPIIISIAFLASSAIGIQAGLAFLGLGSPLVPSFGSMTNDAFANIYLYPEQLVWPSALLAMLIGSIILLGNAYRDALAGPQELSKRKRKRQREQSAAAEASEASTSQMDRGYERDSANQTDAAPQATAKERAESASAPEPRGRTDLLNVTNLKVGYPQVDGSHKFVVDGVSLHVDTGEVVGLVGESGSGKTQTAFSILGLLPPEAYVEADALTLGGTSLAGLSGAEMRRVRSGVISYIPQEPMSNLDPSFTIGNQLVEPLKAGMSRREAKTMILELLDRVGIADPPRVFASYPHQISGGMAQRVLIAGAVASRPKLLIADEPTTALDVTVQAEILDLLRSLQSEYGMGVLMVTHNFGVVADLCDRVAVMSNGKIVEVGDVRTILRTPSHPYTQELISAILDEESVREDPPPLTPRVSPLGGAR
ncbi:dipeptide/oligopeptide/nickel ABC transporter permease/ATP-binding protein [Demequina muriae]|uniref:Dipeptide/oligopeptide/nickel ABC transporter permease/ATP-binding protein n=1 Tax=Demequina muriae TaxID=3051664 RepID=A0ABT8GGB5_9MICO|nr:dipeptide/oligopeptide/nickel ABC transporter permease/ATP-binding protein [Demequina sp. EGI L300058]MDN4480457.1 dipeptide/oligopeptide/nickel ABC transporter permease/ATP-binding protein [Demequina sp. EGI L300058]